MEGDETDVTDSMTCPRCKTRYTASDKTFKQTLPTLPQSAPAPRLQAPSVPAQYQTSQTGQRVSQACISCVAVAAAWWYPNVITITGGVVWFVSLVGGSGNWGVIHRLLDRNHDGKLNLADIKHAVNAVLDEVLEEAPPTLPPIPVHVIRGGETLMGEITGATREQLHEAAKVMFSEVNKGKAFARARVGKIFGENFSRVQKEMVKLGLLKGNDNAGYKLTTEGKTFLGRYLPPSPTPAE